MSPPNTIGRTPSHAHVRARHEIGSTHGLVVLGVLLSSCGDEGSQPCLPRLPRAADNECSLQVQPRFSPIYAETLRRNCGSSAAACHTPAGMAGGLVLLQSEDAAYEALLAPAHGPPLVIPHDPECSPLLARLESDRTSFRMPPTAPLSAAERCAIIQWIADGAAR